MTNAQEPLLRLDDVWLSYASTRLWRRERKRVIEGISLELRRGETLGLLGRNGCGKSTLLRVMAGIIGADSGQIWLADGVSRALLALGLGFRGDLSGRDNAFLSGVLQGNSPDSATAFLDEIKEFSELGTDFDLPVRTYSAGMRSRLAFSSALISHVDILLIDEVLSVGDGHFRKKASEALKKKIKGEQTVVFVSHSAGMVKQLCDRAIWIDAGKERLSGDAETVVDAYQDSL